MSWVEALLDRGIAAAHQLDKRCDPPSLVTKRPHVDFSFSRQSAFTFSVAALFLLWVLTVSVALRFFHGKLSLRISRFEFSLVFWRTIGERADRS